MPLTACILQRPACASYLCAYVALAPAPACVQVARLVREAAAACPSLAADPRAAGLTATEAPTPRPLFTVPPSRPPQAQGTAVVGPADRLRLALPLPWPLDLALGFRAGAPPPPSPLLGLPLPRAAAVLDCAAIYADVAGALLRLRLCAGALQAAWLVLGKPTAEERGPRGGERGEQRGRSQRGCGRCG